MAAIHTTAFARYMPLALFCAALLAGAPQSQAQSGTQNAALISEFHQLVVGKWARITRNAGVAFVEEQMNIAAIQCYSVKELDAATANKVSDISKSVSQKLSRLIVYQKLETGLRRIDFGERIAIDFPILQIEKSGARNSFKLSNKKLKTTISFARLKQNNNFVPVMIEGKSMYLKCPS